MKWSRLITRWERRGGRLAGWERDALIRLGRALLSRKSHFHCKWSSERDESGEPGKQLPSCAKANSGRLSKLCRKMRREKQKCGISESEVFILCCRSVKHERHRIQYFSIQSCPCCEKKQPPKNAGFLLRVVYYEPMIFILVTLSKICSLKSFASSIQSELILCWAAGCKLTEQQRLKEAGVRPPGVKRPQNEQAHTERGVQTFNRKSLQLHVFWAALKFSPSVFGWMSYSWGSGWITAAVYELLHSMKTKSIRSVNVTFPLTPASASVWMNRQILWAHSVLRDQSASCRIRVTC